MAPVAMMRIKGAGEAGMSQEAESVTYRVEDHVAVITLNRPEQIGRAHV